MQGAVISQQQPLSRRREEEEEEEGGGGGGGGVRAGAWPRPRAVVFDVGGVLAASPVPIFTRFEEQQGLEKGSVIKAVERSAGDESRQEF